MSSRNGKTGKDRSASARNSHTRARLLWQATSPSVKVTLEPESVEVRGSHTFSRLLGSTWSRGGKYVTHMLQSPLSRPRHIFI